MFKPLKYSNIEGVSSKYKGVHTKLRFMSPSVAVGRHAPEGTYSITAKGIIFPKRRRGEEFAVSFTLRDYVVL